MVYTLHIKKISTIPILSLINISDHFKERVALFSDGIDDVHVVDSILPEVLDESKKAPSIKKVSKSQNIKLMRDKVAEKDDDEW